MSGVVKFSEASSLALHAVAILARDRARRLGVRDLAEALPVSATHLAKVMQRLVKVGLVASVRGRGGGFVLARDPSAISMLEVYEAVDGPLDIQRCLFPTPHCDGECLFGDALGAANTLVRERLAATRLSDLGQAPLVTPRLPPRAARAAPAPAAAAARPRPRPRAS